jgi:multiple sugar transport system permease protein
MGLLAARKQKLMKRNRFDRFKPYFFILPHIIVFLVFFLYPMVYGIYASFTKWNMFNSPVWVGLENYKTLFFDGSSTFYRQFRAGMGNTIFFVFICVPFQILIPLILSAFLYQKPKGHAVFQSIFYMPTTFSISAVVITWLGMFYRSNGLINWTFKLDINWLGSQPFAWIAIVLVTLWWGIGMNLIIYVAAFSGVDISILESAEIDGAGSVIRFFRIMLPMIKFPLVYTIIISVISQFNIYGQPLMLTTNLESTTVLLIYIRSLAFGSGNPIAGMASAMAVCLGLIIGVVAVIQTILLRKQID